MTILIGTPHSAGAGYYRNDDTASGGVRVEADIRTCTHCQQIINMGKWKVNGAFCHQCAAPICSLCGARMEKFGCEPFIKKLEQSLELKSKIEQFRKAAGLDAPAPVSVIFSGPQT